MDRNYKTLAETSFNQAFAINLSAVEYRIPKDTEERVLQGLLAAISVYLGKNKIAREDTAVAMVLQDTSGAFKFAGIVEYHNNENDDEPGNWSYVMTFDESVITSLEKKKTVKKFLFGDIAFNTVFDRVSQDVSAIRFKDSRFMYPTAITCFETLYNVLEHEAVEGQIIDIELPGYFKSSIGVEDDNKVITIVPDGHLKALIKDDSSTEGY